MLFQVTQKRFSFSKAGVDKVFMLKEIFLALQTMVSIATHLPV